MKLAASLSVILLAGMTTPASASRAASLVSVSVEAYRRSSDRCEYAPVVGEALGKLSELYENTEPWIWKREASKAPYAIDGALNMHKLVNKTPDKSISPDEECKLLGNIVSLGLEFALIVGFADETFFNELNRLTSNQGRVKSGTPQAPSISSAKTPQASAATPSDELSASEPQSDNILLWPDEKASKLLHSMREKGDLSDPQHAAAWVVMSTLALGVGVEGCGFQMPEDKSFLFTPALDGMSEDEAIALNRLVTENYRKAENGDGISLNALYPVARQALLTFSTVGKGWDCEEVKGVWTAGENYVKNKNN